ncbi:hypothetical protein ACTA71_008031 [Dictyostelium dimigraforme]
MNQINNQHRLYQPLHQPRLQPLQQQHKQNEGRQNGEQEGEQDDRFNLTCVETIKPICKIYTIGLIGAWETKFGSETNFQISKFFEEKMPKVVNNSLTINSSLVPGPTMLQTIGGKEIIATIPHKGNEDIHQVEWAEIKRIVINQARSNIELKCHDFMYFFKA